MNYVKRRPNLSGELYFNTIHTTSAPTTPSTRWRILRLGPSSEIWKFTCVSVIMKMYTAICSAAIQSGKFTLISTNLNNTLVRHPIPVLFFVFVAKNENWSIDFQWVLSFLCLDVFTHSFTFIFADLQCIVWFEWRNKMLYLTIHSTHFSYGYMVSDMW